MPRRNGTAKGDFSSADTTAYVRIVQNGAIRSTPFLATRIDASGERGLLGIAPIYRYPFPIALTGILVYQGPTPGWNDTLFWCAHSTSQHYQATLDASRISVTAIDTDSGPPGSGCRADVQHGPHGALSVAGGATIPRIRPTSLPSPVPTSTPIVDPGPGLPVGARFPALFPGGSW